MGLKGSIARIRSVDVQGATNVCTVGLRAFVDYAESLSVKSYGIFFKKLDKARKLLYSARRTEPMLYNVLSLFYYSVKNLKDLSNSRSLLREESGLFLKQLEKDSESIAINASNLVKSNSIIFTHCHSSTVASIIKRAGNKVKRVYCTETRPLFQGRLTAKELSGKHVPVTFLIDSRMIEGISRCDIVLLGADLLSNKGVVNKVGSYMAAYLADKFKKPLIICSHSLKFSLRDLSIEQRSSSEVWRNSPKNVIVENPAFDFIPAGLVTRIVTERGAFTYNNFLRSLK